MQTSTEVAVDRLSIEAAKYLGKEAGDHLPVVEVRRQAQADGYLPTEIDRLLEETGLIQADTTPVPEQRDLLGELWRIDDTGVSNQNPIQDEDEWKDRPSTKSRGQVEPLDESTADHYGLQEPLCRKADLVDKERYLDENGNPLTHWDAIGSYIEHRHGENTSAEKYGWNGVLQSRAKKRYALGMRIDRQLLATYQNPTTALISLRLSPTVDGRLTLLTALKKGADAAIQQLRYRLQDASESPLTADEWEYMAVVAGTDRRATPHIHIYVWMDGDVSKERFEPVVEKFVEKCEFAPDSGRGNRCHEGAVELRGNGQDSIPLYDQSDADVSDSEFEDDNSRGAVYVLTQLPHLGDVDAMAQDKLLHSTTTDAWSGRAFRSSMLKSDIEDRFSRETPV